MTSSSIGFYCSTYVTTRYDMVTVECLESKKSYSGWLQLDVLMNAQRRKSAYSPAVEWVYLKMFVKVFFSFDYSNIGVLLLNSGGCEVLTLGQFKIYTIVDARVTLTQKYRKMAITSILLRIES